jgi:hypothetical protein
MPDWKLAVVRFLQRKLWLTLPLLALTGFLGYVYVSEDVKPSDLNALRTLIEKQSERIQRQEVEIATLRGVLTVLAKTEIPMPRATAMIQPDGEKRTLAELNPEVGRFLAGYEIPVGPLHPLGWPTIEPQDEPAAPPPMR